MPELSSNHDTTNGNCNSNNSNNNASIPLHPARNNSTSQESHGSQTAEEYVYLTISKVDDWSLLISNKIHHLTTPARS